MFEYPLTFSINSIFNLVSNIVSSLDGKLGCPSGFKQSSQSPLKSATPDKLHRIRILAYLLFGYAIIRYVTEENNVW